MKKLKVSRLGIVILSSLLLGSASLGITVAQESKTAKGSLSSLSTPIRVVENSSFISPLVELFGDVSIGQKSFVAGNTVLRADPDTRVCIGNETNFQDNILFLALRSLPAPAAPCGARSSSTQDQVSIAHQAIIKNSRIGNFSFVGFRAHLTNVVLEDGAFVLHGATLRNVRIPKDRIVPIGAVITTQAQANALPLKPRRTLSSNGRYSK